MKWFIPNLCISHLCTALECFPSKQKIFNSSLNYCHSTLNWVIHIFCFMGWIIKVYINFLYRHTSYQSFTGPSIGFPLYRTPTMCLYVIVCMCVPFLLLVPVCFYAELARGMTAACSPTPSSIHPSPSLYYQILIGFSSYYTEIRGLSVDFHFPLCCDNTSHPTHLVSATFH